MTKTLFVILLFSYSSFGQKTTLNSTNYLNNYSIRACFEDTASFYTKDIFSVRLYTSEPRHSGDKDFTLMDGKPFYELGFTEYLRDGRVRFKEYEYDQIDRLEEYHYDKDFKNLTLIYRAEDEKVFNYNWLFYDEHNNLSEAFDYRIYGDDYFDFQKYILYQNQYKGNELEVKLLEYGYDTLMNSPETYRFNFPKMTVDRPSYQSSQVEYLWINGSFKPIKTNGYVFEDRVVIFTYDKKGYLLSETWRKANKLENRTEYAYSADYRRQEEQRYHRLGTEKSTKYIRTFDEQNNLLSTETTEYTGNKLGKELFEYTLDKRGNWIEKRQYYLPCENNVYGKKQWVKTWKREIIYFENKQDVRDFEPKEFPERAERSMAMIPEWSAQKQAKIDEFNDAIEAGEFDQTIKTKTASAIEDFTPKFWEVKEIAYGNVDEDADEEAAVVYLTPNNTQDLGFDHCLAIYKKQDGKWILMYQTQTPLLTSEGGGMMGNPFESIRIQRKCIVISHFGGSRQKWSYTHRYRFQNNDWYLIGATINYGSPCDYFEELDYNLITGNCVVTKTTEVCDENDQLTESSWTEKFIRKKPLVKMKDFTPGNTEVNIPNRGEAMYY